MLKIFNANNSDAATGAVIDELGRNNGDGSKHYVIVPDRFSLSVEKEIFERLELPGACNIDVVSFTRLAVKLLGGKVKKCLSKQGAVIVLRKVVEREKDKLVHYRMVASGAGFPKELYAVIASIRNCGYTPEDLEAIIPNLTRGTRGKAQDIALIYREYLKEIEGNFEDSTTRIDKLIKEIPTSERIAEAHVYIVGFTTFSGKQKEVIAALAKAAKSVNVAVNSTNHGYNSEVYPTRTLEELVELCKENDIPCEQEAECIVKVKEPFNTLNKYLLAHMGGMTKDVPDAEKVVLYQERNVFEEINGVAHEILRLVRREKDYRFKDIAIVNCESANAPIVKSVFERYGIPLYTDVKYPLNETLVAGFLFGLMDTGICNFKKDKVLSFIKEPLFPATAEEKESFENTVLQYNLNFTRFTEPFTGKFAQGESDEKVRWRLADLVKRYPAEASCAEYCKITMGVLEEFCKEEFADELLQGISDSFNIGINAQAPVKIGEILDELTLLLGEKAMPLKEFYGVFEACVSSLELSLIPQSLDSVFMGDLHESRYNKLKALFIIGASAENLPMPHAYQAIISMTDMDMLTDNGFRLFPTPADLVREEEYLLLELFTKVSDRLYMGGSSAGQNGMALGESVVVKEAKELLGISYTSLFEKYTLCEDVLNSKEAQEDFAASRENAFFAYLSNAKWATKLGGSHAQTMANLYATLSEEERAKADKLLAEKQEETLEDTSIYFYNMKDGRASSISEVESYYTCPYRHFAQYGLGLKERKEGDMKQNDVGTYIHSVFEHYFRSTAGKLDGMPKEERMKYIEEALSLADEENTDLGDLSELDKMNISAIKKEAARACNELTEIVLRGSYRPTYFELKFGASEERPPIVVETAKHKYFFKGIIDRMDIAGKRAIIIDYKTGKIHKTVEGLYYGEKLQVFLYQQAAMDMGYEPAGTFYVPIKDSTDKSVYKAVGEFEETRENVDALDGTCWESFEANGVGESKGYPIKIVMETGSKNAGEEKCGRVGFGSSKFGTKEQLIAATKYAKFMVKRGLEDIENGIISKSPLGGCGFCAYKDICGNAGKENERNTISESDLKSAIRFEVGGEENGQGK